MPPKRMAVFALGLILIAAAISLAEMERRGHFTPGRSEPAPPELAAEAPAVSSDVSPPPAKLPPPPPPGQPQGIPIDRLLKVPAQPPARPDALAKPKASAERVVPEGDETDPQWLKPSITLEQDRREAPTPNRDSETRRAAGGVKVSPGKTGGKDGDVSISVEGGVREDRNDPRSDPVKQGEVGVRIDVPWPTKKR